MNLSETWYVGADDAPEFGTRMERALAAQGLKGQFATSGSRAIALAKARHCPPRVLLLDLDLGPENPKHVYDDMCQVVQSVILIIITGKEEKKREHQELMGKALRVFDKPLPSPDTEDGAANDLDPLAQQVAETVREASALTGEAIPVQSSGEASEASPAGVAADSARSDHALGHTRPVFAAVGCIVAVLGLIAAFVDVPLIRFMAALAAFVLLVEGGALARAQHVRSKIADKGGSTWKDS